MFLKKSVQEGGLPFDPRISPATLTAILAVDKMRTISEANGNFEMTLDEINNEIKAARLEKQHMS